MKPGTGLFIASLCWLFLGAAGFFVNELLLFWMLAGICVLPFAIADFFALLLFSAALSVKRSIAGALALGEKATVTLTIRRNGGRPFLVRSIRLFDIYPDSFDCGVFPVTLKRNLFNLPRGDTGAAGTCIFEYPVIPLERGAWEFPEVQFLFGSPLGFWRLKTVHHCVSRGRTFPDFKKIASSGDLRGVLEHAGLKGIRRRGQGMEFLSLREYQKGDPVKSIDWRATGRRGKVIVREYQEEQDQQVLFLLDTGYRLHRIEEAGTSRRTQFDSALEAALLLSWVALKHGDGVAAGCFGAEERWLPPRKGMAALTALIQSLYDVKSASAPSSLFSALENALLRLKRRTFIIMISNFREEDGESLSWILNRITRRHLLLLVSMREAEAEGLARRRPRNGEEALETAAAFSYLAARKRLYKQWEHLGLLTMECSQAELSSSLINRYLELKRSGTL